MLLTNLEYLNSQNQLLMFTFLLKVKCMTHCYKDIGCKIFDIAVKDCLDKAF